MLEMSTEEASRVSQNAGTEQITAENMALLCSKNIKLDIAPIQIPDIAVAQVSVCCVNRQGRIQESALGGISLPLPLPSPLFPFLPPFLSFPLLLPSFPAPSFSLPSPPLTSNPISLGHMKI